MRPLHWLFPPFCAACDRPGHYLCVRHLSDLCWNYQPPLDDWIWSALEYRDSAQQIVIQVKYNFFYRYIELMAQLIALRFPRCPNQSVDYLVPVPLHRKRQRWRGFNQAGLLAEHLGRYWQLPVENLILTRIHYSKSQASQDQENRQKIKHQFQATQSLLERKVLLVDDVVTTGSTLAACREALILAGSSEVSALTFAREI